MKLTENTAAGLHETVVDLLPKNRRYRKYLDVGCGFGALLRRLNERYDSGFGIDGNIKQVAFKNKKVTYKKANFNIDIPFKNDKFDLITCVEVIEHVENQFFLMREMSKKLNKGGLLVVSSPNVYSIFSRLLFFFKGRFINFMDKNVNDHINVLVENIFEKMMVEANGLKIVKKKYANAHVPLTSIYLPIRTKLFGNNVIYVLMQK